MNKKQDEGFPEPIPCNECHAGMMRPRLVTYFTWMGSELISAPNFPAWICDVCGRREYDEQAVSWLSMLLDPNAGKPTRPPRPAAHPRPRSGPARPAPES
jgi:YgiT-type zinc finger domain-containing protein